MAHVGVIKILLGNNIPIDFVAGSSIGAFVGAHWSKYQDFDLLKQAVLGGKKEKLRALLEPAWRGGLVKGDKLQKLLEIYLGKKTKIEELKTLFSATAVDLISGREVVFSKGDLVSVVRASMCIPGIFEPVAYQKMLLVDGGVTNPVPANVVKKMGADIVISVNLDAQEVERYNSGKMPSIRSVASRVFDITRNTLANVHDAETDIEIQPEIAVDGLKSWEEFFTQKGKEEEFMRAGEEATRKKLKEIRLLL